MAIGTEYDKYGAVHVLRRSACHTKRPLLVLAIVDFKKDAPGEGPPPEFRFTPEQISGELAKAGFSLQSQYDFLPRQMFLVYGIP